jgi:hypothetical protein
MPSPATTATRNEDAERVTATTDGVAGWIASFQVLDAENTRREQRWSARHPAWSEVFWPSYIGEEYDTFRVQYRGDPARRIEAGRELGWTAFLFILENACCTGECGTDHSGDEIF